MLLSQLFAECYDTAPNTGVQRHTARLGRANTDHVHRRCLQASVRMWRRVGSYVLETATQTNFVSTHCAMVHACTARFENTKQQRPTLSARRV